MKKFISFIFITAFVSIVLAGCSENRVKVESLINSSISQKDIDEIYSDELAVNAFKSAVQNSFKVDGIVDVSEPMYKFKVAGEEYYLWLFDDGGSLMKSNDTHTIYRLIEEDVAQLKNILN